MPLPRPLLKFLVLNAAVGEGCSDAETMGSAADNYDFASERDRCAGLIEELASKPLDDAWPDSPMLGRMSGKDVSRLHAKHLNHHLTQFGV